MHPRNLSFARFARFAARAHVAGVIMLACVALPARAQVALRVETPATAPKTYTRAALESLSSDTVRVAGAHLTAATYQVITLQRLLALSGIVVDSLRGHDLDQVVLAEARDNYRVVFSLGELGSQLGGRTVLVAIRRNGAPIGDEDAPFRLLVADDMRAQRSMRQLQSLRVVTLEARAPARQRSQRSSPSATKESSRNQG